MEVRLKAKQLPGLANQDIHIIRFHFQEGVPESKGGVGEKGAFGNARGLVAQKVSLYVRAGADPVELGRADSEANPGVASTKGKAFVARGVGARSADDAISRGFVEALGGVPNEVRLYEAVEAYVP